jgi:hypothetical protein
MKDLDRYLIPSETPVVVTRRHWASLVKVGAGCAVAVLVALWLLVYLADDQVLAVVGLLLLAGALGWFGWVWTDWRSEKFVITDKRVLLISGLLTRKVAIMPLSKVTDLTYERSLAGRMLGYGVFVVESAGQQQAFSRIDFLPTPDRLYHDVSTLLFGPRSALTRQPRANGGEHPTTPLPGSR